MWNKQQLFQERLLLPCCRSWVQRVKNDWPPWLTPSSNRASNGHEGAKNGDYWSNRQPLPQISFENRRATDNLNVSRDSNGFHSPSLESDFLTQHSRWFPSSLCFLRCDSKNRDKKAEGSSTANRHWTHAPKQGSNSGVRCFLDFLENGLRGATRKSSQYC